MQCRNCRFENMPGAAACGRCGTSLGLATAVIDVHPPRAKPWRKRVRQWLPVRRAAVRVRDAADAGRRVAFGAAEELRLPLMEGPVVRRLIVPGWAHFYCGQRVRGWIFLACYLGLGLAGLLLWGTTAGSIFLGLAFSAHASAALDIMLQGRGEFPSRFATLFLVMAALGFGLYLPAGWLLTRIASPRAIEASVGPFAEGDVVLVNQWAYLRSAPQPGNVVLYHFPGLQVSAIAQRHAAMRIPAGEVIDRILAGPGDDVRLEGGRFIVNGVSSPWLPLNPAVLPDRLTTKVPANCYLVLPSTLPYRDFQMNLAAYEVAASIPAERIVGKVYLRSQPLWRLGRMH
jgi:hypothetical protein